jgi:hypothetical protein
VATNSRTDADEWQLMGPQLDDVIGIEFNLRIDLSVRGCLSRSNLCCTTRESMPGVISCEATLSLTGAIRLANLTGLFLAHSESQVKRYFGGRHCDELFTLFDKRRNLYESSEPA